MIVTDDGAGHTKGSLEVLEQFLNSHPEFRPIEMHVDAERAWSEIYGTIKDKDGQLDSVYILLSGLNCGYGGEGPHGTINAIRMMGYVPGDGQKLVILQGQAVSIYMRNHRLKVQLREHWANRPT